MQMGRMSWVLVAGVLSGALLDGGDDEGAIDAQIAESVARAEKLTADGKISDALDLLAKAARPSPDGVELNEASRMHIAELETQLYRRWLTDEVQPEGAFRRSPSPRRSNSRWSGRDTRRVRDGVDAALNWLARHQHPDGRWGANDFIRLCAGEENCTGRGMDRYDAGVTGLTLLAFLRAGEGPDTGDHRLAVRHALRWLLAAQSEEDGHWGVLHEPAHTYDHCIAMLALLEARRSAGWEGDDAAIERGLEYLLSLRNPGAGWRYRDRTSEEMIKSPNDASVTSWALHVLLEAGDQGFELDPVAVADGLDLLEYLTDDGGRTGYSSPGGGSARFPGLQEAFDITRTEAMTAVAVNVRLRADPSEVDDPLVAAGIELVAALPIVWDDTQPARRDYYSWYHGTAAMRRVGGDPWNAWRNSIFVLLEPQSHGGEAFGSWDPRVDPWGTAGGRVYATALLALTLEEAIADE